MRQLVLSTLADHEGISVVGEAEDESDVLTLVSQTHPDFLLIGLDESKRRPPLCDLLLKQFPSLRIIAVAPNTNVGVCYWASFEIHSATLEASEEGLLSAMRKKTNTVKGESA